MEKDTYSLWFRPFGDTAFNLQQQIDKLSGKYDTYSFEPHVTLLGGLTYGETELKQLTETLAGSLDPFDIELIRPGYRDTFYQSLFLHAKKSDPLMTARRTAERLFDVNPDENFMPHLSLMYGDFDRDEKERLISKMNREYHITFQAKSLLLVKTGGKPPEWKKIHSAEFRKHS